MFILASYVEMAVVGAGNSVPSLRCQITQVGRPVPRFRLATDHPGLGDCHSQFPDGFIHVTVKTSAHRLTGYGDAGAVTSIGRLD